MKTILGSGQLGIAVMEVLLKANPPEEITLVNRKGTLDIKIPGNVKVVAADVTNKIDMESIAGKSEVIFSCTDVPYQSWAKFYPATALALAHALKNTNAKLVFADNMYSYGNVLGNIMHEDLPHKAQTGKGLIRTSVIDTLLTSGNEFSERVAFVKAADFIGPRIYKGIFGTDFLDKIYEKKTVMLSGKIELPHTFTYINDFAQAIVNVGNAADAFGQIWHAPNSTAISLDKWVHLFQLYTGEKVRIRLLPKFVVRIAGLFNSLIRELYELAYQLEYPYWVDHSKYIKRFGDHSTSPSVIVKETVQWYKKTKSIK
jgi:nucleoside-diphosphate-sugar epimerase